MSYCWSLVVSTVYGREEREREKEKKTKHRPHLNNQLA